MDGGTYDLSGTKIMTVHPEHTRSLSSMTPRHTVHPEHKKATEIVAFINSLYTYSLMGLLKIHTVHLGCNGHALQNIDALDS